MSTIANYINPRYLTEFEQLNDYDIAQIINISITKNTESKLFEFADQCDKVDQAYINPCEPGRNYSPVKLGQLGEAEVHAYLSELYEVMDTTKRGHAGDFIIIVNGLRILIEVKNYSRNVPTKEVDKFYKDIDSNSSVDGGLFISLRSGISNISESFTFIRKTFRNTPIPLVFISNRSDVLYITTAIDIILTDIQSCRLRREADIDIMNVANNLLNSVDILSQTKMILNDLQLNMNKQILRATEQVIIAESAIKHQVDKMRDSVGVHNDCTEAYDIIIDELKEEYDISIIYEKLLRSCMQRVGEVFSREKQIIVTELKAISFKVCRAHPSIIFHREFQTIDMPGIFSYTKNKLTVQLSPQNIHYVIKLIKQVKLVTPT